MRIIFLRCFVKILTKEACMMDNFFSPKETAESFDNISINKAKNTSGTYLF